MEDKSSSSNKQLPSYDKTNFNDAQFKFQKHIINNINNIPQIKKDLLKMAKEGQITNEFMRPFAWKIFLNFLPCDQGSTLKNWIDETISKRKLYKKKIKDYISISKFKGDPLGATGTGGSWDNFFDENDIKHLIKIDVERTFQDRDLFCEFSIKEIEKNILYIFSKENAPTSYKQGMNDILAMIIFILYPFYTKSPNKKYTNELLEQWINNPTNYTNDIYTFFNDETEFESDIYYLFLNLMKLGVNKFYEDLDEKKPEEKKTYLIKRCENVTEKKLKLYNNRLYYHFLNIGLDSGIILQRWIKCLFTREFHPQDCSIIWDAILASEVEFPSNELIYIDYFSLAMMDFISDELLRKDQNECFKRLFQYPPLESMTTLITLAEKIKPKIIDLENKEKIKEIQRIKQTEQHKKDLNDLAEQNKKLKENLNNKQTKNSMANFFFGTQSQSPMPTQQVPVPMFANNNNMFLTPQNNQNVSNQMFQKTNLNVGNKNQGYVVSDSENMKMLKEIKELVYKYKDIYSKQDKMKIDFLVDKLEKNV